MREDGSMWSTDNELLLPFSLRAWGLAVRVAAAFSRGGRAGLQPPPYRAQADWRSGLCKRFSGNKNGLIRSQWRRYEAASYGT
jgi:hypothetical protein